MPGVQPKKWQLIATGAGVIVYQLLSKRAMRVLLSVRTKNVGQGYGITGGGFVEVVAVDALPIGSIVQTADDAHREAHEENKGFAAVISADAFLERAQPVGTFHVRTADSNRVHGVTMYALRAISYVEWMHFAALEPGVDIDGKVERDGPLLECLVEWTPDITRRTPEAAITMTHLDGAPIQASEFFHGHEVHAIATIAWNAEKGRLWLR